MKLSGTLYRQLIPIEKIKDIQRKNPYEWFITIFFSQKLIQTKIAFSII